MTKHYYIPNQTTARPEQNPGKHMLKNRQQKLADRQRIANDCRFIPAHEWAVRKIDRRDFRRELATQQATEGKRLTGRQWRKTRQEVRRSERAAS